MFFKSSSDSRILTEYKSNCVVNNKIMKDNKITSQYEYRKFLQENAEKLMETNKNSINKN